MILDELVLHDFGVYGGRQVMTLTPVAGRPIILVGGLNGGGKTTILEALQLCLYGSAAPGLGRMAGGYPEFLRRRIHRGCGARSASVELAFRHLSNGVQHAYRVVRSWSVVGRDCRETFEVFRDGRLDRLATDNWAEQVEEFMPSRIASLFLFDGEKVESYADPDEAPALIATAVHNLLGLDLVERLSSDLTTLERRRRTDGAPGDGPSAAAGVRDELAQLQVQRLEIQREVAGANDGRDRVARDLRRVEDRFRREGGDLYERRLEVEAAAAEAEQALRLAESHLREVAGGNAPLLLVASLLEDVRARDAQERGTRTARQLATALESEHAAFLSLAPIADMDPVRRSLIEEALAGRRAEQAARGASEVHLDLGPEATALASALTGDGRDDLRDEVASATGRVSMARSRLVAARRALDAMPSAEALAGLQAERDALRAEQDRLGQVLAQAETDLSALDRRIGELREREARLAEQEANERFRREDSDRMLAHSARVRGTLLRFREAVVARHVARIEALVLESFVSLARKQGLVTALRIDPSTFRLTLLGADGAGLSADQLSAGERQLLAVALLWGMAKASGRPLPTVIDTPLGRLDSEHRSRLVERYFPAASHQVILLSTDEEISGGYRDALSRWIGRSYRLDFDAGSARTTIADGFVPEGGLRRVA